ncbi:MAG: hypothetical protein BJBARM5_0922 [Candidatus Parvarchaeum acidophilus ARMAN-5]|jgi:flagellar biosynthesis protein FliR|uniref:Uncharacterized protein n=1 Tax=Candidatus Parvarchaeum acidophilus ARMAN-5 TaxID=662762 RepID=D6GWQ1_PARA5|nr:MAG: hypothetical protein BJBARM5_0922 [Candidatus Parvarchaeum acidophilus ARMAN-5]
MFFITVFVLVDITEVTFELIIDTYTYLPFGLTAIPVAANELAGALIEIFFIIVFVDVETTEILLLF